MKKRNAGDWLIIFGAAWAILALVDGVAYIGKYIKHRRFIRKSDKTIQKQTDAFWSKLGPKVRDVLRRAWIVCEKDNDAMAFILYETFKDYDEDKEFSLAACRVVVSALHEKFETPLENEEVVVEKEEAE